MSEAGRHERWARGERPPWWPENEPFPPHGAPHRRRRFMRRMGCFAFMAILVFGVLVAIVATLFHEAFLAPEPFVARPIGILLFLLVIFGIANALRGARRLTTPMGDLIDAAERVEHGDYAVRVGVRGPRELRSLARAFNAMSARLERSETERRRLLADVTHELRTPLTIMQGNVEGLIDGIYPADRAHLETILEETNVLSRLVDDLRTLSLAESGALALHREMVDVRVLAGDVASSFKAAADAAGVTVEPDGAEATANVDPVRVREVIGNLVANAIRYSPKGGRIAIVVASDAAAVSVTVRDTGPGIAPEVLEHLFERFTRSDESRGSGLGLAIAKSLVSAHGGAIGATSTPGQGTEIRFTLPREGTAAPS